MNNNSKNIFFLSGLPRSGSTLISNIMGQNPYFHVTPTSACHDIMFEVRNFWHKAIEHKASKELANNKNLQRVLNSILFSYHDTNKPFILDKGRGWLSLLEMAEFAMGSKVKVIVPVRDISEILSSFEKLHRKNAAFREDQGNYFKAQTVEGRCYNLLADNSVLGLAYNRLKDSLMRGFRDRMFFVEFDELTHNPHKVIDEIYNFLDIPKFSHTFNNIEQLTKEDDSIHGIENLHTIRKKIEPVRKDSHIILGESVCEKFKNSEFWRIS